LPRREIKNKLWPKILRISKAIGFFIAGIIVLFLSVLRESTVALLSKAISNPETLLHTYSFLKFMIIAWGLTLIGIGAYNLTMVFVENDKEGNPLPI
jgi:uncharacterized membrane protein